jgi:glycosyltransferase involved in cell wall biosynthesis
METVAAKPAAVSVGENGTDCPRIAILIPCYNEEQTILQVVESFRRAVPNSVVYVYDNNSKDRTREIGRKAGAVVRQETLQGKGNVVRRMFADVEADIYLMVDGDDTYDAEAAPGMIKILLERELDMVVGRRVTDRKDAYRSGHRFGNTMMTSIVAMIFGNRFRDLLSGYRVFSRRFVKSFPAVAAGFEIETELAVHALELRMPTLEVDTPYKERPEGSVSKLQTYRDGWRILMMVISLTKEERPFQFFGAIFGVLTVFSIIICIPLFITYAQTGLVPRLPTAVLAVGAILVGIVSLASGLILDTVTLGRREAKRMRYLEIPFWRPR